MLRNIPISLFLLLALAMPTRLSLALDFQPPQPSLTTTSYSISEAQDVLSTDGSASADVSTRTGDALLFPELFDDVWTPSAVAEGADGSLHFVAHILENGRSEVYYVRSKDGVVLEKMNLSDNLGTSLHPDLLLQENAIHVVWQNNQTGTDQVYYRWKSGGVWHLATRLSKAATGAYAPEIEIGDDEQLRVQWKEYMGEATYLHQCTLREAECTEVSIIESTTGMRGDPLRQIEEAPGVVAFLWDGEIWTVREIDLVFRRVTNSGGRVFAFAWSPDGLQFAYTLLTDELEQLCDIYVINEDGTGQRRLTTNIGALRSVIDWHDNKIAFLRNTTYPYVRISYVTTSGNRVDVSGDISNYGVGVNLFSSPRLQWSPDGQWIAVSHGEVNAVVALAGLQREVIRWYQPDWHPNSDHLVYDGQGIGMYYPASGSLAQLSSVDAYFPTYSPAGNYLVYGSPYLRRMNSNNTGHTTLVYDRAVAMDWSTAGEKITYMSWYDNGTPFPGIYGIYVVGVNGSGRRQLVNGYAGGPAWQPVIQYSISGRVTAPDGSTLAGVLVSDGAGHTATSDSSGNYALGGLSAGTYTIRANKGGYVFCPVTQRVELSANVTNLDFTGFGANVFLGFCPNPNGYSFSNSSNAWGSFPFSAYDYGYTELIRMFGQEDVCWMTGTICWVKPQADLWHLQANLSMNGGHCDGMASTSLRFFKGVDQPSNFKPNATTAHELGLGDARRHIAYYFVEQLTDPVLAYKNQIRQNTLTAILNQLRSAMQSGAPDPITLFVRQSGQGGHAITPFAIEDRANGISWVRVYDNNHPDDLGRYVVINTIDQTWSYNLGSTTWTGDANTQTLGIVPISEYAEQPVCPWCDGSLEMTEPDNPLMQEIWLNGSGHLLVTDAQGRRIGYAGAQFVSDIPGGYGGFIDGGLGIAQEPIYKLPVSDSYTILLDGQTVTQPENVTVSQFGPGYATQIDNIRLQSSVRDSITIAADGSQITYQPNGSRNPTLSLALDDAAASYKLSVTGAEIAAGQRVTVAAQESTGRLVYSNAQASGGDYGLFVRRVSSSGVQLFAHNALTVAGGDTHYTAYRSWDGQGSMTLLIDHASNGTIDETVTLENQIRSVYLPEVVGN